MGIVPVYSLKGAMKQNDMKAIVKKALEVSGKLPSVVPIRYQEKYRLLSYKQAITQIHQPSSQQALQAAIRTLRYEEFLCFQCVMQAINHQDQQVYKEPKQFDQQDVWDWCDQLAYPLTPDQKQAIVDVMDDMEQEKAMFRLVQGDVGCGKTTVALASMQACWQSGWQSALLAPTEILARQHVQTMQRLGLPATLYVSALSSAKKKEILQGLKDGSIPMVVGTHALFQESVSFAKLGLVVTDEQQRFGVRQRRSLLEKGSQVDFLMMSATPIPRTYAHFIYGNMDISNIKTMPQGREPVETHYVKTTSMKPHSIGCH